MDDPFPTQELAKKIAAATGQVAVSLKVVNRSSLTKGDFDRVSRDFGLQLGAGGIRIVTPEQASIHLEVSLSENVQSYVWVAELRRDGTATAVVMASSPRPAIGRIQGELVPMTIRKTPLWSQEARILDVVVLEESASPMRLAVLSSESVAIYRLVSGNWQLEQSAPITHSKPWPRDMRGRLLLRQGRALEAYLPGVWCQSPAISPMSLACRDSDDPWPLSTQVGEGGFFTPSRNFFTGVLTPSIGQQTSIAKFYSAAPIAKRGQISYWWLFAMIDGTLHLLDGSTEQTLKLNWGSDLAAVKTGCGGGWQILATGSGDTEGDLIRAYEMVDREPVPVSAALDFAGGVTALWSDDKGTAAIAVFRNAQTGTYEAFRLAVACGQ